MAFNNNNNYNSYVLLLLFDTNRLSKCLMFSHHCESETLWLFNKMLCFKEVKK